MAYPFCTHRFSCLYANIKKDSASVMQDVLAPFPFIMFTFIQNFTCKRLCSIDTGGPRFSLCAHLQHVKLISVFVRADSVFYCPRLCESTCLLFLHISLCCDMHISTNNFLSVALQTSAHLDLNPWKHVDDEFLINL